MKKVHFISIGGSAMHNLAIALAGKGYLVTGSDDEIAEPSRSHLASNGLLPADEGWHTSNILPDLDAVILGMHARANNPELLRAQELGIPIYSYPEYIYQQSKDKLRVVIGGSHGKTSTTAMIMHVLKASGIEFDYLIGASLQGFDVTVRLSETARVIIIEGDEYLSSAIDLRPKFHLYRAHLAVLTGIAWDHINVFPTFENYLEQFRKFLNTMVEKGTIIYYAADENLLDLVNEHTSPLLVKEPYSMPRHRIEDGVTVLLKEGGGEVPLKVFGEHNLLNLSAAYHVLRHLGISNEHFYAAVGDFKGAARRLEMVASNSTLTVYWDFAHSPSKLKATIAAVRDQFPSRKIVACMELHTFSSLNAEFLKEYSSSMDHADTAIVFYSHTAAEHKDLPVIGADLVCRAFGRNDLSVIEDADSLMTILRAMDLTNSILLFMSSGNFSGMNIKAFARSLVY